MRAITAVLLAFVCSTAFAVEPFAEFTAWQASNTSSEDIAQGLALAKARRGAMAQLIRTDPNRALAQALSLAKRQDLPATIQAQLEAIIEADAVLTRRASMFHGADAHAEHMRPNDPDSDMGTHYMSVRYEPVVMIGDLVFERHSTGALAEVVRLEPTPVRGIALDGHIALAHDVARVVSDASELVLARSSVRAEPPRCAASSDLRWVRFGASYQALCGDAAVQEINAALNAQLDALIGGPIQPRTAALNPYTTGPKTFLYIRIRFADQAESALPTEAVAQAQITGLSDFMSDFSYGQMPSVTGTITPVFVMANPMQYYTDLGPDSGITTILSEARALAVTAGFMWNQYSFETVRYVGGPGGFAGAAYVGARGMWLKTNDAGVAAHELGHNLGLLHANDWATTNADPLGAGVNNEYGNPYDRLGSGSSRSAHFTASSKARLSWLAPELSARMWGSGDYSLQAQDQTQLLAGPMALLLLQEKLFVGDVAATIPTQGHAGRFWLEHRTQTVNFASTLHTSVDARENWLLDTTPRTRLGKLDAGLRLGDTLSDLGLGIHITPLSMDSSVNPPRVNVRLEYGEFAANVAPTLSISASNLTPALNTPVTFTATASDSNGDAVSYSWEREDLGVIVQSAPSNQTTQSFSAAGKYRVRVRASDRRGGVSSASVVVTVGTSTGFSLSGRVLEGGVPVENVIIGNGLSGTAQRVVSTDSDGRFVMTNLAAGSATLIALKRGSAITAGFTNPLAISADMSEVNFTALAEPRFLLERVDAIAQPGGSDTATLRIRRVGTNLSPKRVFFRVLGNAFGGSDYTVAPALNAPIEFAQGQAQADIVFTALNNTAGERTENVIVSLFDGVDYELAFPSSGLISINGVSAPVNDDFAARTPISGAVTLNANNSLASLEDAEPPHGPRFNGYSSLWWEWTAPASGTAMLSTPGTATAINVDVYRGNSLAALQPIGTMFSRSTALETLRFDVIVGTKYQIAVSAEPGGAFTLRVEPGSGGGDVILANGFE